MSIVEELYNNETGEIDERLDLLLRTECEMYGLEYPENCIYKVRVISRELSNISVVLENIPWEKYTEVIIHISINEHMMSTREVYDCTEEVLKEIGE